MPACPSCASENTRKRSVINDEGTSNVIGLGVFGSGLSLGFGRSKTKLAKKASFAKGGLRIRDIFLSIGFGLAIGSAGWTAAALAAMITRKNGSNLYADFFVAYHSMFFWTLSGIAIVLAFFIIGKENSQESETDVKKEWMCLTCGSKF